MANLTITLDEEALKRARIRAAEQGTSVNAVLRDFLESYAGLRGEQDTALDNLTALAKSANAARGGAYWARDDLHERSS